MADIFTERLRRETYEDHMLLHVNPLMVAVIRGKITENQYVPWNKELYHIHSSLETLAEHCSPELQYKKCFSKDQVRSNWLKNDLEFLTDSDKIEQSLDVTLAYHHEVSDIWGNNPDALLGAVYVFEGAASGGGSLLASKIRERFNFNKNGISYLEGHGSEEKNKFNEFKQRLNDANFSKKTEDEIISCASITFHSIDKIYKEIMLKY